MLNTEKITFRCIGGHRTLYTPEYMFDVEAMRTHLEYEELDANGEVVKPKEANPDLRPIPMTTKAVQEPAVKPSKGRKR